MMSYDEIAAAGPLSESMFRHRAVQFVARQGWPLRLTNGLEIDEFDAPGTVYAVFAEGERHLASVRLRPAQHGSMVERHFPAFWHRHADALRQAPEVTRLCTAPRAAQQWRHHAVRELLIGLCGHCLNAGTEQFFGVVYPSVARTLARIGWGGDVVERVEIRGEALVLATWRVSHLVYWNLQAASERQDDRAATRAAA
jgi:N-acyl-L-homoserine lactone synthetase